MRPTVSRRRAAAPVRPDLKTPRTKLMRLEIEAELCAEALPRVLGLIARIGRVPAGIAAARGEEGQHFEIELDPMPAQAAETLIARIENIVSVRWARLAEARDAEIEVPSG